MSGLRLTFDLDDREFLRELAKASEEIQDAAAAGLYTMGQMVIATATPNVPVDISRLKNSVWISIPRPGELQLNLGYAVVYALRQHETHRTKAGWLKNAVDAHSGRFGADLADWTARFFAGKRGIKNLAKSVPSSPSEREGPPGGEGVGV